MNTKMNIQTIPASKLKAAAYNPRRDLKPGDAEYEKCRLAWWNEHRDSMNRKAVYRLTCAYCGEVFDSYGNKSRKYCSHACYIKDRFGRHPVEREVGAQ